MIFKIEDSSSFLTIAYLAISIAAVLMYEWDRKDSFDPFSGIVLFSLYFLFELVFVPVVRAMTIPEHYEQGSWYGKTGWLDNDFVIYATTFNLFAYWMFSAGYYISISSKRFMRISQRKDHLKERSSLWISMMVIIASVILIIIQAYWLVVLGQGINIETIIQKAVFERAKVYSDDPSLSIIVSLMHILAGLATIVILSAFVPLLIRSKVKIIKLNWCIAYCIVLVYGISSGFRLLVLWPIVTPLVLLFYFGNLSYRRLKKITVKVLIAFAILAIILSHIQTGINALLLDYWETPWGVFVGDGDQGAVATFLNRTINLVSRDTFAAVWGIINYYSQSENRLHGATFVDIIFSLVPRRIWEDKKLVYGSDEVTLHMDLPQTTRTTIGIHGELFANFGYLGVIAMLVYGWIFGYIDGYKRKSELTLLVFATYFGVARALVHFDFGFTALFISTYTSFLYWMVLRVIFYKRFKTNRLTVA
jgi:oligosaccharide repeat unit polymerase